MLQTEMAIPAKEMYFASTCERLDEAGGEAGVWL
jgi:hypothetical protein